MREDRDHDEQADVGARGKPRWIAGSRVDLDWSDTQLAAVGVPAGLMVVDERAPIESPPPST